MDLIIVRHARPERVENDDSDGPADPPLSQLGIKQARAVADFLKGEKRLTGSCQVRCAEH